jgi:hypothetical protein
MGVRVVHRNVEGVATGAPVEALVALARRTEHHELVSEPDLGVRHAAVLAVVHGVTLESERPLQEVDRGLRVVVLQGRIDALDPAKVP